MPTFKDKKHLLDIAETIHCYLGQKSPDCILYSQDGFEYPVHKVITGLLDSFFVAIYKTISTLTSVYPYCVGVGRPVAVLSPSCRCPVSSHYQFLQL